MTPTIQRIDKSAGKIRRNLKVYGDVFTDEDKEHIAILLLALDTLKAELVVQDVLGRMGKR